MTSGPGVPPKHWASSVQALGVPMQPLESPERPPGPGLTPHPQSPPLAPRPAHRLPFLLPPPEGAIGRSSRRVLEAQATVGLLGLPPPFVPPHTVFFPVA